MKRAFVFLLSFILIVFFSWSYFHPSFFRTHDFTHVARVVEMKRALEAGHIPPHWSQNLGYGYGMPLFLFYGPFPFFVATAFTWLGFTALSGVKLMAILSNVVAFAGMYRLTKRWGTVPALIAASLYLAAPYRAVDLFVRGALNEAWALSLLPWILHAALSLRRAPRVALPALAASTALLILTHNLTALFSLPLIALAAAVEALIYEPRRWRVLLWQAAGWIWGGLLSLFYLVPAFVEKGETQIEAILSGYFSYHHHFLYIRQLFFEHWGYGGSGFGPDDGMSFHLGWPLIILLIIFALEGAVRAFGWAKESWETHHLAWWKRLFRPAAVYFTAEWLWVMFLALLGLIAAGMTLTHSEFVWNAVPLLSFIQFPWRFLTAVVFFWSIVAAFAVSQLRPLPVRWFTAAFILIAILFQGKFHKPEEFLERADDYYYTDASTIRRKMSNILPDYIPKGFDASLPPVAPENRVVVAEDIEYTASQYEHNDPQRVLWHNPQPEPTTITWNIAHFPGWIYEVNGVQVKPDKMSDGRMQYQSTQPVEWVSARFTPTPLRTITLWVSTIAFLGWIGYHWRMNQPRKQKHLL